MVNLPRWQIIMIALIVLHGVVYAAPNVLFSRQQAMQMADEGSILPHQQISLGLDLRGGVYLLLSVDLSALVEQDRENLQESIRGALNEAGMTESQVGVVGDAVEVTLPPGADAGQARSAINALQQGLVIESPADGTLRVSFTEAALRQRTNAVMAQSVEVMRRRIDETGTRDRKSNRLNSSH